MAAVAAQKPGRRNTRAAIINAGIELMWQYGYSDVSVDNIIDSVGVQKGSFYYFFQSKQEFLLACFQEYWVQMKSELDEVYQSAKSPGEGIIEHMKWFGRLQQSQVEKYGRALGGFHQSIAAEVYHIPEIAALTRAQGTEHSQMLLEAIMAEFPDDPPAMKLQLVNYCINGALYQGRVHNNLNPTRELPDLVRTVLWGLEDGGARKKRGLEDKPRKLRSKPAE
ncbi:MAG: TetR/AcrR family transcriptional regulator [Caulobacterales bacterium]